MNPKLDKWREKIAFYLDDADTSTGKFIDLTLVGFNLLACALYVISSYRGDDSLPWWLLIPEILVASEFIIEYLLRVWTARNRWKYIFSFYGVIDFITILPSLITQLRFLRVLKVLRVLRFLRFFEDQNFFFGRLSKIQLQAFRTVFTIFTILFLSSGFILDAEQSQGNIKTFGESFYYCVTTLSTVGFGDFVPVTPYGRLFTVIMILGGAILIPWQAGKLVRMLIVQDHEKQDITCAKCGLTGHEIDASHCKACGEVIYQKFDGNI